MRPQAEDYSFRACGICESPGTRMNSDINVTGLVVSYGN